MYLQIRKHPFTIKTVEKRVKMILPSVLKNEGKEHTLVTFRNFSRVFRRYTFAQ